MAKTQKQTIGAIGETIAADFLIRKGFSIISRNYRKPYGEIDIIAEKSGTMHFVEVKTISREMSPSMISREIDYRPEELAHERKLEKVARTASAYMGERGDDRAYQVDVVGVVLDKKTHSALCRFFEQVL